MTFLSALTPDLAPAKVDVGTSVNKALDNIFTFVPKLVGALVILLVFYVVARVLKTAITKVLQKVGFDDVVERGGIKKALEKSSYDAAGLLATIVYYLVLLFGLSAAFGVFGPDNPVSLFLASIIAFLPKAFVALIIIVIAAAIATAVKGLLSSALGEVSYGSAVANVVSIFILFQGVVAALGQVGIATAVTVPLEIAVLATLGGIAVVGVGGGLIVPMRERWENTLTRVSEDSDKINRPQLGDAVPSPVKDAAQQRQRPAQGATRAVIPHPTTEG